MNTAIVSPTGGSVGISFTTPSNLVKSVVDQLALYGETRRGYFGVNVQKVTTATAKSYKLDSAYGALLTNVAKDGPAEKSGLKRGDLITSFNGQRLEKASDLALKVAQTDIEASVEVGYVRKRKAKTTRVTIERLVEKVTKSDKAKGEAQKSVALGIAVEDITDAVRRKHRIRGDAKGVRVTAIDKNSGASGKLRLGDVIEAVDLEDISDVEDFAAKVKTRQDSGLPPVLLINRGGTYLFYTIG